jgi:uncharacterized membrane protein
VKILTAFTFLFITAEAPDIFGSLLQLGAVAFIALVLCYKQTKQVNA